jgi:chitodextrinase
VLWRTTTNSVTITGTLPSRTYRFSVRALDEAGNSSTSPPPFKLTMPPGDNQPPTAPSALTATRITDTTVTVSWGSSTDNIGVGLYEVLSITPSGNTVIATRPMHPPWPNNVLDVTRLTPGTTYTFAMRAADDAGNYSALSAPVTVTTRPAGPDVSPPNTPGTPVASNLGPRGVTLTWAPASDDSGAPRYELVDRTDPGGPVEVARSIVNQVTVALVPDRTYVFVVHAVDAAGNRSTASAPLTLTAPSACRVDYRITSQWPGGFQADVRVQNTESTVVDGWTLGWTFPVAGQQVRSVWNAVLVGSAGPDVTVRNVGWNGRIPGDGSTTFGFVGAYGGGGNPVAGGFTLNGVPCRSGAV